MWRRTLILALGAVLACSRPRPSPEYERARALWTSLVRDHPQAPGGEPLADEILALLQRVPRSSVDAQAASSLWERIESERRMLAEERTRREGLVARAAVPASPVVGEPVSGAGAPTAPASERQAKEISPGMKLEEFRMAYGACFEDGGPVRIGSDAAARSGEMWVMKDDQECRDEYPALAGQTVLFAGDAVAGVSPLTAVRRVEVRREVELGILPDGGTGMVVDGRLEPLPAGAKLVTTGGGAKP